MFELVQQAGTTVFQKIQDFFETGCSPVIGIGHFLVLTGNVRAKGLDLGSKLGTRRERGEFREIEVIHGQEQVGLFEILVRYHAGAPADRKVAGLSRLSHARVRGIAVMLTDGTGRVTGDRLVKFALLEQLAEGGLGGGRATNVSPTNKKNMHLMQVKLLKSLKASF